METSLLHKLTKRESNRYYFKHFMEKCYIDEVLLRRLQLEHQLEGHTGCVNCLDWNISGSLLASGSDDTNIILWNPFTHKAHTTIQTGHRGNVFSVKFFPQMRDRFIASGAADSNVFVHDVTYNEKIHGFSCNGRVKRLVCTPESPHCLWCASEDGIIREFDIRESSPKCTKILIDLNQTCGEGSECKCLALNPIHSHMLAVGASDPYVRLYDRRMLKKPTSLSNPSTNGQKRKDNMHFVCDGCATYFIPGHLHKQGEHCRRKRSLCATYLTFNSHGDELLVNVGGEHVYLYDLNMKQCSLFQPTHCSPLKKSAYADSDSLEAFSTNSVCCHSSSNESSSVDQEEMDKLPSELEALKAEANGFFLKKDYTRAIVLYNKAILKYAKSAEMYRNRAAAYLKREWDGDVYAALRDCYTALSINPFYAKANYQLTKCLYELRWLEEANQSLKSFKLKHPEYAQQYNCIDLENSIKTALKGSAKQNTNKELLVHETELQLQNSAFDYTKRYCGHCNTTTDIKEANFFGNDGQYIVAGSDDGLFFVWERQSSNLVHAMRADDSIVNCVQPHPFVCMLASSGIDPFVRLWSPSGNEGNDRIVKEIENAAAANQKRMNNDPYESVLLSLGMRGSIQYEGGEGQGEVIPCRPS